MCPAADTFLHQVVGGRWRLLEILSATEHGTAFRAETVEDGRLARLELWEPHHVQHRGELARFEREARTLSRLRHQHCLSLVAFGAHEGRPFLVSDLPNGKLLRDELGTPELTVGRAVSLGLLLCEGLRHLHRHGVVHRALRPENLWVAEAPPSDLMKIGLPRLDHSKDGSDPGERLFLPPERSTGRPDHRADLYAAGMLLYVMCTGRMPAPEVVAAIAGGASAPPPRDVAPERGISEALERVILRAVAPAPAVRFKTADELMSALLTTGVRPVTAKRPSAQRSPARMAVIAAAFAAAAVLGATALSSSRRRGPSAPPLAQAAEAPSAVANDPAKPPAKPSADVPILAPPAIAPPAIEAAPAAPAPPARSDGPPSSEHNEIWSLLESNRLDEGAKRLKALVARDPDAAWPRFALGVLYYRKYWRQDALRQWQLAVAQDPEIQRDPQFGAYLCFMLDDAWSAAGMTDLLDRLGAKALPLLGRCVASAKNPRLRSLAVRASNRLSPSETSRRALPAARPRQAPR